MGSEDFGHGPTEWRIAAREVAKSIVARNADEVDGQAQWPAETCAPSGRPVVSWA